MKTINEKTIRLAVRKIMNEAFGEAESYDDDSLEMYLNNEVEQLNGYAWELETFKSEFNHIYQEMMQTAQSLGLECVSKEIPQADLKEILANGLKCEFYFGKAGVDVDSMSDEEYDNVDAQMDDMVEEFESAIKMRYKAAHVEVFNDSPNVRITIEFGFWS